jgi:hypothetical protein
VIQDFLNLYGRAFFAKSDRELELGLVSFVWAPAFAIGLLAGLMIVYNLLGVDLAYLFGAGILLLGMPIAGYDF